eukprot:1156946-Pelagomonas_calceolata.AAC.1
MYVETVLNVETVACAVREAAVCGGALQRVACWAEAAWASCCGAEGRQCVFCEEACAFAACTVEAGCACTAEALGCACTACALAACTAVAGCACRAEAVGQCGSVLCSAVEGRQHVQCRAACREEKKMRGLGPGSCLPPGLVLAPRACHQGSCLPLVLATCTCHSCLPPGLVLATRACHQEAEPRGHNAAKWVCLNSGLNHREHPILLGPRDLYSLARCKSPLPMGLMYKLGMPLPADQVEMYHENVEWEEFN